MFADGAFQHAHSVAVYDSNPIHGGESSGIEKFINLLDGLIGSLTDYI